MSVKFLKSFLSIFFGSIFLAICREGSSTTPVYFVAPSTCHYFSKCPICHGYCVSDNECEDGLFCFQRNGYEPVPGCSSGGPGDHPGYRYCAATTTTVKTTTSSSEQEFWRINIGKSYCEIVDDGRCVTDGDGDYGNNEYCEVVALQSLVMSAKYYKVEAFSDYVTVDGVDYHNEGPNQVHMNKYYKWTWKSDHSDQYNGFKICAYPEPAKASEGTDTTITIVITIVVLIAILAVVTLVVLKASKPTPTQRARTTQTPTVHRTMTPVAITAETSVSNVPMATETGIRSSLTVDADMFMPSVPSSEIAQNFDNIPVATAAPAVDTVNTSVAASQHTENPANMPVAVARDAAESGNLPVVVIPSV